MINVRELHDYFQKIHQHHSGINKIFLATNQSQILIQTRSRSISSDVYVTLTSDFQFIIGVKLAKDQTKVPMEIIVQTERQWILMYTIESHFILGAFLQKDALQSGRALIQQILSNVSTQLQHVDKWVDRQ